MLTSVKRLLRYPQSTDTPDVPRDISNLVADLEAEYGLIATRSVLDVGVLNQTRAGRVLTLGDFTTLMGLSAPAGLWNLGDLTDVSGNARNLTNKGAVPFGKGITGAAAEAAVFSGSAAQALYIADVGAGDPFRIKTGSWGAWMRTAKRGATQNIIAKSNSAATAFAFGVSVSSVTNTIQANVTFDGSSFFAVIGNTDVADDRWHFVVATFDGSLLRLYVDGVLEAFIAAPGTIFASSGPLNIGAFGADGATVASNPHYGRIDQAFITADVLSEDQVRMLYAVKLAHGAVRTPRAARLGVRRRRRGGPLVVGDFSATPKHLYNFTAGSLNDDGSLANALTNNGAALSVVGADGAAGGAYAFASASSQYLSATDAGLPAAFASRSYGCWFKTTTVNGSLIAYGTLAAGQYNLLVVDASGNLSFVDGSGGIGSVPPFVADGQWHFCVLVADNAATDGLKNKLYVDGKLIDGTATLTSTVLSGTLRIGREVGANTRYLNGSIDSVFITDYAMAPDEIASLYAKGSLALGLSPKNPGEHIEQIDATNVYFIGDTLESQNTIDLAVEA